VYAEEVSVHGAYPCRVPSQLLGHLMDDGGGLPEGSNLCQEVSVRIRTELTISVGLLKLRECVARRPEGGARFLRRLTETSGPYAG
jgi:hypothetical protein